MNNNYNYDNGGGNKDQQHSSKPVQSKFEYDLYDETKNKIEKIIRVKNISTKGKERWKIFENDEVIMVVEGEKLTKKHREFLHTLEGVSFLITEFKKGIKSLSKLKSQLKSHLNKK